VEPPGVQADDDEEVAQRMRVGQQVFNRFLGPVHVVGGSTIGIAPTDGDGGSGGGSGGGASGQVSTSRRMTGRVSAAEIATARTRYAVPAHHDRALAALRHHRVIVLYGRDGTGRRTSAINILRDVSSGSLVTLSPGESVDKLAEQAYRKGNGYLLCGISARDVEVEASDFNLGRLVQVVQDAKAWLVITSQAALGDPRSTVLPHFRWEPPSTAAILEVYGVDLETADLAVKRMGEAPSVRDVAHLAEHLATGADLEDALGRTGMGAAEQVSEWLDDEKRTDGDVLEAAALLFLEGMPEQRFEAHLARLAARIPTAEQPVPADDQAAHRSLLDRRRPRRDEMSIITTEHRITDMDMTVPGPPRRCLVFRSPAVRDRVAAELGTQFGEHMWSPIFAWVHETVRVADAETRMQIAWGLAMLAGHDHFDAIREEFLQPWSEGAHGMRAWASAPYVVWWMSVQDGTAAMAVRTAIRWARSRNPMRKQAACLAFAGEVGMRYPADAARWLWQLVMTETDPEPAQTALAQLYALLVEVAPADAKAIVADLDSRIALGRTGAGRARIVGTLLPVLAVSELGGKRPALARHLLAREQDLPVLASVLAVGLCHRPIRAAMLAVLYDVLATVGEVSRTPERHLREIGAALREALPPREHAPFHLAFQRYVTRRRSGGDLGRLLSALLTVFLECR
jgi:hypothetical protein